ncbi:hypothetical protein A8H26_02265 [Pluralibacter gergoviae]|nr:hypothetical protein A8H26_02265 [Pluralibacter gergoviae]
MRRCAAPIWAVNLALPAAPCRRFLPFPCRTSHFSLPASSSSCHRPDPLLSFCCNKNVIFL